MEKSEIKVSKNYAKAYKEMKELEAIVGSKLDKIRDYINYPEFMQVLESHVKIKNALRDQVFDMKYNIENPSYYESHVFNNPDYQAENTK
jgi:hypothetical protein